jgi:hypothetical protein
MWTNAILNIIYDTCLGLEAIYLKKKICLFLLQSYNLIFAIILFNFCNYTNKEKFLKSKYMYNHYFEKMTM